MNSKHDYRLSHWLAIVLSAFLLGPIVGVFASMVLVQALNIGHNAGPWLLLGAVIGMPITGVVVAFVLSENTADRN